MVLLIMSNTDTPTNKNKQYMRDIVYAKKDIDT